MKLMRTLTSASLAVLAMAGGAHAEDQYVVGVSNTLIGNGWREEMICSIKAEAQASGKVSKVVVANRNGGPSEQIADIRNLISAGVNIIIINPSDREALNPVIKQAADKDIVVVAVDQAVSAPEAYVLTNDQVAYAKLGAEWLFEKLGGKGNVVEMRGIDGVPADADRHEGFTEVLKNYPDIKVTSVFTGWALNKTAQDQGSPRLRQADRRRLDLRHRFDGRRCLQVGRQAFVPVVGADNNGFIGQLIDLKEQGLSGAAVSNPPAVGGAGLGLALDILAKKEHRISSRSRRPLGQQQGHERAQGGVRSEARSLLQRRDQVPPYTQYTPEQIIACKGP